jgi:hypothetical protein
LDLSGNPLGKLSILGKLKLLGSEERRLISSLSELRNHLVHDVRNHRYSLTEMVSTFDHEKLRQFAISFSPFETQIRKMSQVALFKSGVSEAAASRADLDSVLFRARGDPKSHIWAGSYSVLVAIVDMYGYSDYKQWLKARSLFEDSDE